MMRITFQGHSDDVLTWHVDGQADEIGCYDSTGELKVTDPDGAACVVFRCYAQSQAASVWHLGVRQVDEDVPLPIWVGSVRYEATDGYSPVLSIFPPLGSVVEEVR